MPAFFKPIPISPQTAVEKGGYRLRNTSKNKSPLFQSSTMESSKNDLKMTPFKVDKHSDVSRTMGSDPNSHSSRSNRGRIGKKYRFGSDLVHPWLLVAILAFLALLCFGIAYFLLMNRSASFSASRVPAMHFLRPTTDDNFKVIDNPRTELDPESKTLKPWLGETRLGLGTALGMPIPGTLDTHTRLRYNHISGSTGSSMQSRLSSKYKIFRPLTPLHQTTVIHEKYLAYLSHSGLNNQRLALENALILSALLNRTLIIPPIRLSRGTGPRSLALNHESTDELSTTLVLDSNAKFPEGPLGHCIDPHMVPEGGNQGREGECSAYDNWTWVGWETFFPIGELSKTLGINIIERWDFSSPFLSSLLGISLSPSSPTSPTQPTTKWLKDTYPSNPRQYAYSDLPLPPDRTYKGYENVVHIEEMKAWEEKLIHVGTMFGTTRLRIQSPEGKGVMRAVREGMRMKTSSGELEEVARGVAGVLGGGANSEGRQDRKGGYISLHLRVGDGIFDERREETARGVWWGVMRDLMGFEEGWVGRFEAEVLVDSVDPSLGPSVDGGSPGSPGPSSASGKEKIGTRPPSRTIYNATALRIPGGPSNLPPLRPASGELKRFCRTSEEVGIWAYLNASFNSTHGTVGRESVNERIKTLQDAQRILSTPIFISTDALYPHQTPLLRRFRESFPCVFFLEDFWVPGMKVPLPYSPPPLNTVATSPLGDNPSNPTYPRDSTSPSNAEHPSLLPSTPHLIQALTSLSTLTNPHDNTPLSPFLTPFLSAMVLSRGARVIGTPRSTYSRYVEDCLWRGVWGLGVKLRGGK